MRTRQTISHLPIDLIVATGSPVRESLGNLDQLVATITDHGLLNPITVTEHPTRAGHYQLLSGRRRFAAALLCGMNYVPAIVRHGLAGNHVEQCLLVLAEDAHEPLGDMSRAQVVKALLHAGLELPAISSRTGMDAAHLIWLLTLLDVGELDDLDDADDLAAEVAKVRNPAAEAAHFNAGHRLAEEATSRCRHRKATRLGGVACGPCWERTIADAALRTGGRPEVDASVVAVAVEGGQQVRLNSEETKEAVRQLTDLRYTAPQIAQRLGVSVKTVQRARAASRVAEAV